MQRNAQDQLFLVAGVAGRAGFHRIASRAAFMPLKHRLQRVLKAASAIDHRREDLDGLLLNHCACLRIKASAMETTRHLGRVARLTLICICRDLSSVFELPVVAAVARLVFVAALLLNIAYPAVAVHCLTRRSNRDRPQARPLCVRTHVDFALWFAAVSRAMRALLQSSVSPSSGQMSVGYCAAILRHASLQPSLLRHSEQRKPLQSVNDVAVNPDIIRITKDAQYRFKTSLYLPVLQCPCYGLPSLERFELDDLWPVRCTEIRWPLRTHRSSRQAHHPNLG